MTLARKMELLAANAAREIPRSRRKELLAELAAWIEVSSISDARELFWILEAGAMTHMEQYLKQLQADEGEKILRKSA